MGVRNPVHVGVLRPPRVVDRCRSHQQSELDRVIVVTEMHWAAWPDMGRLPNGSSDASQLVEHS